jgi:hypothetical protein
MVRIAGAYEPAPTVSVKRTREPWRTNDAELTLGEPMTVQWTDTERDAPVGSWAVIAARLEPVRLGRPEMTPVEGLIDSPAANSDAE